MIQQMATVTLTETGLTVTVEEARTLVAVAFIFSQVFDDFDVKRPKHTRRRRRRSPKMLVPNSDTEEEDEMDEPGAAGRARQQEGSDDDEEGDEEYEDEEEEVAPGNYTIAFQINLNVLIDCLNIFGTAGPVTAPSAGAHKKFTRQGQGGGDGEDQNQNPNHNQGGNDSDDGEPGARRGGASGGAGAGAGQRTLQPVSLGGQTNVEKKTSVRMAYAGDGYPLQLIV